MAGIAGGGRLGDAIVRAGAIGVFLVLAVLTLLAACSDRVVTAPEEQAVMRLGAPLPAIFSGGPVPLASAFKDRWDALDPTECVDGVYLHPDSLNSDFNPLLCSPTMRTVDAAGELIEPVHSLAIGLFAPIVVEFAAPVADVVVLRRGSTPCAAQTFAGVVAYGSSGTELGASGFAVLAPCEQWIPVLRSEAPGAKGATFPTSGFYEDFPFISEWAEARVAVTGAVARLVIAPPAPWSFFNGMDSTARTARYYVMYRAATAPTNSALRASRSTVLPVFASRFNAVTQVIRVTNQAEAAAAARRDTVRITIPGVEEGSLVRRNVTLVSRPIPRSGGHVHSPVGVRPRGTFFLLNELGQLSDGGAGTRDRKSIRRPIGRDTAVYYRTSGVSGEEWLLLRQGDGDTTVTLDSLLITVQLPGLVPVAENANFFFAQSMNHGNHDRYLWPGVAVVLDSVFAEWRALNQRNPTSYPMTNPGRRFKVDAMSLPLGGLHDIYGQWTSDAGGHELHREGLDVDVNDVGVEDTVPRGAQSPQQRFIEICEERRYQFSSTDTFNLSCPVHGSGTGNAHFHVYMVPQTRRGSVLPWRR